LGWCCFRLTSIFSYLKYEIFFITSWSFFITPWCFFVTSWCFFVMSWCFFVTSWSFFITSWSFFVTSWSFFITSWYFYITFWSFKGTPNYFELWCKEDVWLKEPIISRNTLLSVVSWSKIYSNYFLLIKQKLFRFNSNHAEAVTRYGAIIKWTTTTI